MVANLTSYFSSCAVQTPLNLKSLQLGCKPTSSVRACLILCLLKAFNQQLFECKEWNKQHLWVETKMSVRNYSVLAHQVLKSVVKWEICPVTAALRLEENSLAACILRKPNTSTSQFPNSVSSEEQRLRFCGLFSLVVHRLWIVNLSRD